VPMLAARLIRGEAHHEQTAGTSTRLADRLFRRFGAAFDGLDSAYRRGLEWTIRHRFVVLGLVGAATGASLLLLPQIGTELMPQTDSGDFSATIKLPPGTALERTNATILQAEQIVMKNPDVMTVFSAAGTTLSMRGTTGNLTPYQGSLSVKLKEDRKVGTQEVMNDIRKGLGRLPGVRAMVNTQDIVSMMMTGGSQNIEVDIFGDDLGQLFRLGKEVMAKVRDVPGLENVDLGWQEAMPEIQWRVDRVKANQMGVSFADVANTVNTATNGTIASYFQESGFQYPIMVQIEETRRKSMEDLRNLTIRPTLGAAGSGAAANAAGLGTATRDILLRQVASPTVELGPSQVTRLNRRRYIAVTGLPQGRSTSLVQADVEKAIASVQMPAGYYWDWGSTQKRRADEFSGMGLAVFLSIGLIYMLLASQYESFIHPLTVLASVPLSSIGVILALFLTGRSFGLTAFIGLLMLVGIVVKNGILLVEYTNQLRARGMSREEAVLTAGPTRLRPILMTTSAAILGMLPIAIGLGKGSEIQAPMATAVIGGLATSTALTLFVIPTVYTLFDDLGRLLQRNRRPAAPADEVDDGSDTP